MLINEKTSSEALKGLAEEHRNQCVSSADFKVSGLHARLAEAYSLLAGIAEANERQVSREWLILENEFAKR
ncbi:hypothetical protein EBT31_18175 [bacterium]|nr:hypothetical protein [bacterium]